MPLLEPDGALDLAGVRIRSIGVGADVDARPLGDAVAGGDRDDAGDLAERLADYGASPGGVERLTGVLEDQDVRAVLAVPLDDLAVAPGGPGLRALDDDVPSVEITVEAPPDDEGQVVLEIDASGVVSWHLPVREDGGGPAVRGATEQVFRIPVRQGDVPGEPMPGEGDRGVFGIGTRKLLHVLRYPIRRGAGAGGRFLVGAWENRHRKYGLRLMGAGGLDGTADGFALDASQLAALSGRPTLMLVHGTFSTARSAFAGLSADAALLAELSRRYDGRVLLFDHPSLHVGPVENARWLLERVPPEVDLVLDVVAHSRGGLVSRALTAAPTLAGGGCRPPEVRTMVHVAAPNAGTVLAQPERWGTLLDSVTNLAMMYPDDTVSVPLTAVVETVKQVGTGVLDGLDGLAAMNPDDPLLTQLAPVPERAAGRRYAVASDFTPDTAPVPVRALDVLVDAFFKGGNDLVVPTEGVSHAEGLVIDETLTVPRTPAVAHTTYFRSDAVRAQLATWLQ